jgi:DNA-directed RNA polymerase specialized sigma subunit
MRGGDRIDPLDLMQLAVVTFMRKLETWDESKGSKMITYYYREVRTQMQRHIMGNAYSVRQGSVFLQHLAYTISRIRTKWLAEKEIEPTNRELSKETGVSQNTIAYCLKVTNIRTKSLDDCPILYKNDFEEKEYPVIIIIENIHHRLGLSDETSLFALYASLEDKDALPEKILELFKQGG